MMKKASKNNNNIIDTQIRGAIHSFSQTEIESLRRKLLQWYDVNKRDLPWRNIKGEDTNHKAYAVWVSEIMCQQTQVATVIDYYNKWMKKWPTLESLSKASLEEVREVWAGLGYYSRGQRLFEGACKVQNELDGQIPGTAEQLRKELPGVGRYTAGAIASISFSEATGVVDGNVIRVLSRLRMIGADSTTQNVMTAIWDLANTIVDPDRPGDFNQSMMELGATVCHPKSPQCPSCPVQSHCRAIQQMDQLTRDLATKLTKSNGQSLPEEKGVVDIECAADGCSLCMDGPLDANLGVMNYPRKPKKKPLKQQVIAVCIVERETNDEEEYLIVQRPDTGLLAGMWEFPSIEIAEETSRQKSRNKIDSYLKDTLNMTLKTVKDRKHIIQFVHMFSHIHQTYELETMKVEEEDEEEEEEEEKEKEEEEDVSEKSQKSEDVPHHQWVSRSAFEGQAVSAGMRKAFDAYNGKTIKKKSGKKSKKSEIEDGNAPKQRKLDTYFTKKEEKTSRCK
ncbi:adenine DNA glycosylase-like [Strongylocentrotus purpuratus]|uniref:Adenine DNA glycosylase n=1 Tax=Strongylocentrotus purpuratus TaxID=7668 RepID=A0A7M7PL97_STRPU|nr:adenine DNA glycosylase-like [Strongylocentrotus purpuratus]